MVDIDKCRQETELNNSRTMTDSDALILVDQADRPLGQLSKQRCHEGRGILHRAFSLLIFNSLGELLLQQRSASKRLWPLYWSNSVCSHPRNAEGMEVATHRRLREELGITCDLHFLFKFEYRAQFDADGAEHELCSVFAGRSDGPLCVNPEEIADWRWVAPEVLHAEMGGAEAAKFTPWFILEWTRLWRDHRAAADALQCKV
jgi:isopentenyl-diphosphate Delta-isomerase